MVPPWEQFPTYERYSMGWRMGAGEQYIYDWSSFIDRLPKDYETRLDYLQRYRPAPLNWRDSVRWVLRPDVDIDQENGCGNSETERLLELGLIAYDAAYQTWLVGQLGIQWPWKFPSSDTPEEFARYRTREFWFFSRQFNTSRSKLVSEAIPAGWECVAWELLTGRVGQIDTSKGLLTLSKMLCAGCVQAPWVLGLTPVHCTDSFEMDMGYCDAYKLWLISAFDDKSLLTKILKPTEVPKNWADWMHMHTQFG